MILSTLYALGISVILSTDVSAYCENKSETGCYLEYPSGLKQIYLKSDVAQADFQRTFWHEVGHALTYGDEELNGLCEVDYNKEEFKAFMYDKFRRNPDWLKNRYPLIYTHFKNRNLPL